MRYALIALLVVVLAGCATGSDYQFGDASSALLERQAEYCSEADPVARAAALAVIRAKVPDYPVSGLCTDAEKELAKEIAERAADMPEGVTIDIEQARKDRERFE